MVMRCITRRFVVAFTYGKTHIVVTNHLSKSGGIFLCMDLTSRRQAFFSLIVHIEVTKTLELSYLPACFSYGIGYA